MMKTKTMTCRLREDGIVESRNVEGAFIGIEEVKENLKTHWEVAEQTIRPLMVDITKLRGTSKEARVHANIEFCKLVSAMGIVTDSHISKIIGNVFLYYDKPSVPTKLFYSDKEALAWLEGFKIVGETSKTQ